MQAVWTPRIASPGLARVRDIVHVVSLYNIYSAVLRSDLWALPALGTPGTASVYKMRLRADPHRSQITLTLYLPELV